MGVLSVVSDFQKSARKSVGGTIRKGTSPLSVAALGGTGAYAYKQKTDVEEEAQRTDRYSQYQKRIAAIENQYASGEISHAEMERLKEEARQAFYNSNGDDNPDGLSFTELIAQMGSLQLLASAGVVSLIVYFVLRPVAQRIATDSPSVEEILG